MTTSNHHIDDLLRNEHCACIYVLLKTLSVSKLIKGGELHCNFIPLHHGAVRSVCDN